MFSLDVAKLLLKGQSDIIRDIIADYVINKFTLGIKNNVSEFFKVLYSNFWLVTL